MTPSTSVLEPLPCRRHNLVELLQQQLSAIDRWALHAHAFRQRLSGSMPVSREEGIDIRRRLEVVDNQTQALQRHLHSQLQASGEDSLPADAPLRAVIAHRDPWFRNTIVGTLAESDISVTGETDNGADAVGVAIAEQPDLLVVQGRLAMMNGPDVIRLVAAFCPSTLVAGHVDSDHELGGLLDAGAHTTFSRRMPPAEIGRQVAELVASTR